ncbi:MAG: site-2 protease family protein [Firmicutes bacterium]|nr:site-2 protease family protein [Bacillota bacterium]
MSIDFSVILMYLWGIFVILFTFGFMIFVHELGHFLMAKRVGITVHEFALGFGPRLFRYKREGDITEYCLRIVPFGGFVRMEGEDEPGDSNDPGNFNSKSVGARAKVIVAGCVMNYVTGITLLLLIGFTVGLGQGIIPARVATLKDGYPLQMAGVKVGDEILKVDGVKIGDFEDLQKIIQAKKDGDEANLEIKRGNEAPFAVTVKVKYDNETKSPLLGFSPPMGKLAGFKFTKAESPMQVLEFTATKTLMLTFSPVFVIHSIVSEKDSVKRSEKIQQVKEGSAGPVGIGHMLFEVSKMGIPSILFMCSFFSILIGAFNLMPFPGLDGSRLVFLLIEKIRNRPVDPDKEGFVHQMGFIALIVLVLFVTWNDIMRLVHNQSFFN